jgi:hypothetical protein
MGVRESAGACRQAGVRVGGPHVGTRVGKVLSGKKTLHFLAETLPKLRFFSHFTFFVITQPDGWVQCEG